MISGRDALAQIDQAIYATRADESRLDATLASAIDDAARARAGQLDAYRALARLHVDSLAGSTATGSLDAAESRALALLAEQRERLAGLAERRAQAARTLADGQSRRHDAAGRLEDVIHRIDALTAATRARLAGDADWQAADAKVTEARTVADRAAAKATQAEADRVTKGAPYESDRLFMYLWGNGFGTSRYAATGLVRALDRKVAQVADFIAQRPNYAMLNEIPLRLREHASRLADEVATRTQARTAIERHALEADGIGKLEAEFAAIKAEIDGGNADLASVQSELAGLDASHGALIGGDTPQVVEALDQVAETLAHQDLQTLYARAFATPTPDDEKIVRRIEELGNAVAKAEAEVAATRETIRATAAHRAELEDTRERFRTAGWDRPGVSFGNDAVIGNLVGGVVGGLIGNALWSVLASGVQTHRPSGDIFGGGPRLPGGWGGSSDGGSSGGFGGGGGFTTGGGFGGDGGDSSTGGGF
ncbi:hypothetical protein [Siculibacillus lacustris]|uniref:hypothetical protein n=1 Tax=Siculibacillus lacustris TaxID=1549641 RepID=UPI0019D316A9|nr:hypothetical protein [Siculibacillus lacustris]